MVLSLKPSANYPCNNKPFVPIKISFQIFRVSQLYNVNSTNLTKLRLWQINPIRFQKKLYLRPNE